MITTTTPSIEGKKITKYHGIVLGETILGANFVRDFMASITDFIGGRSKAYEESLNEARQTAIAEMEQRAAALGANAIVGVDIDYETIGQSATMVMVSVSGTAVTIE